MLKKILIAAGMTAASLAIGHAVNVILDKKRKPIAMVQPGDMIQWESSGKFVFPVPRKVERVHESEMGIYVFVEGSSTGIPADQVVLIQRTL